MAFKKTFIFALILVSAAYCAEVASPDLNFYPYWTFRDSYPKNSIPLNLKAGDTLKTNISITQGSATYRLGYLNTTTSKIQVIFQTAALQLNYFLTHSISATGTYYLRISHYFSQIVVNYQITVNSIVIKNGTFTQPSSEGRVNFYSTNKNCWINFYRVPSLLTYTYFQSGLVESSPFINIGTSQQFPQTSNLININPGNYYLTFYTSTQQQYFIQSNYRLTILASKTAPCQNPCSIKDKRYNPDPNPAQPNKCICIFDYCAPVCGNRVLQVGEVCDNGNKTGCLAGCQVDLSYACTGGIGYQSTCSAVAACGNRVREVGEQCDNGNYTGCINCIKQPGFYCTQNPNNLSTCTSTCGDNKTSILQQCDNTYSSGCVGCLIEVGYFCTLDQQLKSICQNQVSSTSLLYPYWILDDIQPIKSYKFPMKVGDILQVVYFANISGITSKLLYENINGTFTQIPFTYLDSLQVNSFNFPITVEATYYFIFEHQNPNFLGGVQFIKIRVDPSWNRLYLQSGVIVKVNPKKQNFYTDTDCVMNFNSSFMTFKNFEIYQGTNLKLSSSQPPNLNTAPANLTMKLILSDKQKYTQIRYRQTIMTNRNSPCHNHCSRKDTRYQPSTQIVGHCICMYFNCPSVCGNQILQSGQECDNGNQAGCSQGCKADPMYKCTAAGLGWTSVCQRTCGNGVLQAYYGEQCDNGNQVGCTNCKIDAGYSCQANGTLYGSICAPIYTPGYYPYWVLEGRYVNKYIEIFLQNGSFVNAKFFINTLVNKQYYINLVISCQVYKYQNASSFDKVLPNYIRLNQSQLNNINFTATLGSGKYFFQMHSLPYPKYNYSIYVNGVLNLTGAETEENFNYRYFYTKTSCSVQINQGLTSFKYLTLQTLRPELLTYDSTFNNGLYFLDHINANLTRINQNYTIQFYTKNFVQNGMYISKEYKVVILTKSSSPCQNDCSEKDARYCPHSIIPQTCKCLYDYCRPVCGNMIVQAGEQCDNGDQVGCVNCTIEPFYACTGTVGMTSTCEVACGDFFKHSSEQCDNGNKTGCINCFKDVGYTCTENVNMTSTCTTQCGDGVKADVEQCDNGNQDGCVNCTVVTGYRCSIIFDMSSDCDPICGDGLVLGYEQCDTGYLSSSIVFPITPGCLNCVLTPGYSCKFDPNLNRNVCQIWCGDGVKGGTQQCDNGNLTGCINCKIENGFRCSENAKLLSTCVQVCGDYIKTSNQQCDNGNQTGCINCVIPLGFNCLQKDGYSFCLEVCGDYTKTVSEACDNGNKIGCVGCVITAGYSCIENANMKSACTIRCGDGVKGGTEQCDNGNITGCFNCVKSVGFTCTENAQLFSVCSASCGDGIRSITEHCDNGNQTGCIGCVITRGYTCTEDANLLSTCAITCGDNVKGGTEQCDNGNTTGCINCAVTVGYTCSEDSNLKSTCSIRCGDGVKGGTEQCDNGNLLGCIGCVILPGYSCTENASLYSTCSIRCGDNVKGGTEKCDNGNNPGCINCVIASGFTCTEDANLKSTCGIICGDGVRGGFEQCDNGNVTGCINCTITLGYSCTEDANLKSTCSIICGDNKLGGTESCDNGNSLGCSNKCVPDAGYSCTGTIGSASVCSPICGDSKYVVGEACDNGNTTGCINCTLGTNYSCINVLNQKSACYLCGNLILEPTEQCDIKNSAGCNSATCKANPGYYCSPSNSCQAISCGNYFEGAPETCDDGNKKAGDGCSGTCLIEPGYKCTAVLGQISVCSLL